VEDDWGARHRGAQDHGVNATELIVELGDALAWLDRHQNLERMLARQGDATPDPARMARLVDVLGHPEAAAPVIHITGTNGKTSTSRAIAQLLMSKGLSVGLYLSPHLERINERISADGEPISDADLAQVLSDIAEIEPLVQRGGAADLSVAGADGAGDRVGGSSPLTWFEIITAAALRWFADRPVDVAVIEVGIGGRWDATNVVEAAVAVVTTIGLDHTEFLGPTRDLIAREKAGIITPGAPLVLAETDPDLLPIFEVEGPSPLLLAGRDWEVARNEIAVGGRVIDVRTPWADHRDVFVDLHGRYQADNFATALVAVEAFFDAAVHPDLVAEAAATVASPGRLEVVGRQPLVVLDGAKNVEGATASAASLAEEFGEATSRILVVGMLAGKDPADMLDALGAGAARLIVTCAPPSPRAQSASELAAAAARFGVPTEVADTVADALDVALAAADPDDLILVSGSLYVVGAARTAMAARARSGRAR
jgi:dihydrofolate synthase/folylpolyglutamate synthase